MKYVATLNGKKYEVEIERVDEYRPLDRGAQASAPAPILAAAPAPKAAPAPAAAPVAAPAAEEEELVDDLELVAVITAAIAASTNSSTDSLVVRSIKRAPGAKWKRA